MNPQETNIVLFVINAVIVFTLFYFIPIGNIFASLLVSLVLFYVLYQLEHYAIKKNIFSRRRKVTFKRSKNFWDDK